MASISAIHRKSGAGDFTEVHPSDGRWDGVLVSNSSGWYLFMSGSLYYSSDGVDWVTQEGYTAASRQAFFGLPDGNIYRRSGNPRKFIDSSSDGLEWESISGNLVPADINDFSIDVSALNLAKSSFCSSFCSVRSFA